MTAWTDFLKKHKRPKSMPFVVWMRMMSTKWKRRKPKRQTGPKKTEVVEEKKIVLPPPSTETIKISETIQDKVKRLPDLCRDLERLRSAVN